MLHWAGAHASWRGSEKGLNWALLARGFLLLLFFLVACTVHTGYRGLVGRMGRGRSAATANVVYERRRPPQQQKTRSNCGRCRPIDS